MKFFTCIGAVIVMAYRFGIHIKILLVFCVIFLAVNISSAAVVGDIDGNGKIELSEAIYALQVAAGQYPDVSTSCQLAGKSVWKASTDYVECDVVNESGSYYICTTNHTSSTNFASDSVNWIELVLGATWNKNGSDIYYNNGNVGIGTTSPVAELEVAGGIKIANDSTICDASKAGTLRWSGSQFEGCNGTEWGIIGLTPSSISTVTSAGQIWLDRNLGASRVATSLTDSAAYGDLYQWGRLTDGHEKRLSLTTPNTSPNDNPGHGDFITSSSPSYDWRIPQSDNLWQGISGINNPCPTGFRLPTETELETERASWYANNAAGAFASPLKLVVAGSRSYDDTFHSAGKSGYYWSSTVDNSMPDRLESRILQFSGVYTTAQFSSHDRGYGYSVRCIKD